MTVLNRQASNVRLGTRQVARVYAGSNLVWPAPMNAFLLNTGTWVFVWTPNTPDLQIVNDVRFRAFVRDDSVEAASSRIIAGQQVGVSGMAWRFGQTYNNSFFALLAYPTGANTPQMTLVAPTRTLMGLTPPGVDRYVEGIATGIHPTSTALTLRAQAGTSEDGITWSPVGAQGAAVAANSLSFPPTNQLRINPTGWLGRIYWVTMEEINRAQLRFSAELTNNYLSTPDTSEFQAANPGDLDVVWRLDPSSWRPATLAELGGRYLTSGPNRSWRVTLSSVGGITLLCSFDGVLAGSTVTAGANIPAVSGPLWLRVTRVASTGVCNFYTAPDNAIEPTVWTQFGTANRASTPGPLFTGVSPLTIGGIGGATTSFTGYIRRFIMRNGIAGPVLLDVNESHAKADTPTSFLAASGQLISTVGPTLIMTPIPDRLVFRFDADDWLGGNSFVGLLDGRTWTLSAINGISRPS